MKAVIKSLILLLAGLCWQFVSGQCVQNKYAFQAGERLSYEVAYNWGVIWVDAGKVVFKTDTISVDGEPAFFFDSYGESYKFYDWFYKVRDRYQSVVKSRGFYPVWFTRVTSEGGYEVDNRYDFNWTEGVVVSKTENSNRPETTDTLQITPCTYDVLSAIYYARTFDFESFEQGEKIPLRFIIDGEFFDLYIRYLGREMKRVRDGKVYDCIKFSAMLVEGTIFSGGEDMIVWVTADENRIPVMVEAKILIGSIKAYIKGYEKPLTELHVED